MALFVLLALPLTKCYAQFNSSVEGIVTDPTGAVVQSAKVMLHSVQTGVDLRSATSSVGYFRFNALGPGDYLIVVEAQGFTKKTTDVHVTQDQASGVNVSLALAGATAAVTVVAQADALNPDETRLQSTLDAEQIGNLPLANGNILETLRTAPGVSGIDEDRNMWAVGVGDSTSAAQADGRPNTSNSFQLDGVSIQNNSLGTTYGMQIHFVPNQDMVGEVALEANNYGADVGQGTAMRVNITTKGGSNRFHGDISERYSGRGLNAIGDYSVVGTPNSRRVYLGSVGGPIFRDRTFFFFSYLDQNQQEGMSSQHTYLSNDFGTWAAGAYPNGVLANKLLAAFPVGTAALGQTATMANSVTQQTAQQFFGLIPAGFGGDGNTCGVPVYTADGTTNTAVTSSINGQVASYTTIPCTLAVFNQGIFNQTPKIDGFQLNGRLDQYFRNGNDRFYGAYLLQPANADYIHWRPGFSDKNPSGARYLNFNYTHIFSPNIVNQLALAYVRTYFGWDSNPSNVVPFLLFVGGPDDFTDIWGTPGSPEFTKQHSEQLRDDVNWTRARHNFKFGFRTGIENTYSNDAGYLSRATWVPTNTYSDLLDDIPNQYTLSTLSAKTGKYLANIQGAQANQFSVYAQDEWKLRPDFLLTVGLRWEAFGNPSAQGSGALPLTAVSFPSGATFRQAIINNQVSSVVSSSAFAGGQNFNFLPRVGFAWMPSFLKKISVHGGIGLYEDPMSIGGVTNNLATNAPGYLNVTYSVTNPSGPTSIVHADNFIGTNWKAAAPFGMTYSDPAIAPGPTDSHGEPTFEGQALTTTLTGVAAHLKPQKTALYNLQVERELKGNLIVGIGYSGNYSWGQIATGDYNTVPGDLIVNNNKEMRLSSEWASINYQDNLLDSNYNAFLITARQNYHRLSWQASYAWAKTLTYGGLIPDIYDPQHYYGPATGSVPKLFNGSIEYELPGRSLHNHVERGILAGWEVSSTFTAQAGSPFSVYTDHSFVPLSNAPASEGGTCVPGGKTICTDVLDPRQAGGYLANGVGEGLVNVPAGLQRKGFTRSQWKAGVFSSLGYTANTTPAANSGPNMNGNSQVSGFINPTGYGANPVYGNQGYNSFYGPGYLGIDGALHKKVLLPWFGEQESTLLMGLEAQNAINRVNLLQPGATSSTPGSVDLANPSDLGVSEAANQARIVQVVFRFQF